MWRLHNIWLAAKDVAHCFAYKFNGCTFKFVPRVGSHTEHGYCPSIVRAQTLRLFY